MKTGHATERGQDESATRAVSIWIGSEGLGIAGQVKVNFRGPKDNR
jgi:hypothetical protein